MTPDRILVWSKTLNNQSINAGAAGTAVTVTERTIIGITVPNANCYFLLTASGSSTDAANSTGTRLPTGTTVIDTGPWQRLSIFNDDAGASRITVAEFY